MKSSTLAVVACGMLLVTAAAAQDNSFCNLTNATGAVVADLFPLQSTSYNTVLVRDGTETNITVMTGWCAYEVNSTTCNATNAKMTFATATECIETFDGVFAPLSSPGPGMVQIQFFSTWSTSVANAVLVCDTTVAVNTAVLDGYVSKVQQGTYVMKLKSSVIC
jgi:hypothetical protein